MGKFFRKRYWREPICFSSLILIFFLLFHSSIVLGYLWTNFGLLELSHASITQPKQSQLVANRAELLLQKAVTYDPRNQSAWRGLGFALAIQEKENDAVFAWHFADATIVDIIGWGEWARESRQYTDSLAWYERAIMFDSRLGDPQYHIGLTYEEMGQWQNALNAYERTIDAPAFLDLGKSTPYYRIGMIYHRKVHPLRLEDALGAYETALKIDDFNTIQELADVHYRRGEILRWQEADPDEYISAYEQAVLFNPKHALARIWLGTSYYIRYKDVKMAESEIQKILEIDPQYIEAYIHLGDIYRQEEQIDEALALYRQALAIDPESEAANKRLRWLGLD